MVHCKRRLAAAALMSVMFLGAAICAHAAPGDAAGPRYQIQPYGQALSPQQQQQARQIYDETMAATNETRQTLNLKRGLLDQELGSPNPDGAKIEALSREIGELRGKLLAARAQARARLVQQGLPPDGFGANDYYRDNRGNGWGQYYPHGRGHGHGHGRPWGCGSWNGMGMGMMGW